MDIFTEYKDGLEVQHEGFTLKLQDCEDTDADLSYLGAFSDTPAPQFAIKCKSMGNIPHYKYYNAENVENDTQALENYKRALDYGDGWVMKGVKVVAYKAGVRLGDASLWGIESDSDASYFLSVANELAGDAIAEARETLKRLREDA